MKTRFYILITGLLMAATQSSFGQEIVNRFELSKAGMDFFECSLFENSDGTLLFRTMMCPKNTYSNYEHLLLKTTSEGEVLDSLKITCTGSRSNIFRNPIDQGSYILTDLNESYNEIDNTNTITFRMFFIDESLNLNNEISTAVYQIQWESTTIGLFEPWFIDSQNDIIFSLWTDNVLHLFRIGLDGTVKTTAETDELFAPNYQQQPPLPDVDTTLYYANEVIYGFGVASEVPLTYYLLGGFYPESGPWPVYGYFFDADFNLIGRHLYDQYDENLAYDGANSEHLFLYDDNSYLMVSEIRDLTTNVAGVGIAKYDMNHNLITASPRFGSNSCYPLQTEMVDGNTIYQLYHKANQSKLAIARLDENLDLDWDYTLPQTVLARYYTYCMTVLKNGDIVAGGLCSKNNHFWYGASFVTLHDDYDPTGVAEIATKEKSYTLYPNPVKDVLSISYAAEAEPESIMLFDVTGRLVGTQSSELNLIDMSRLPEGTYLLNIGFRDGLRQYERVVKQE